MTDSSRRPQSLAEELRAASQLLTAAGSEDARLEAEMLAAFVLGVERNQLLLRERALEPEAAAQFAQLLQRRAAGEPVAYLEGSRGFWGLEFAVDARVLIPRPDSETLIEAALDHAHAQAGVVSDWGTGSGALLLSFLSERPNWTGSGVDSSADALRLASDNAHALGLADRACFVQSDWGALLPDRSVDLILCNPPYIEPGEELGPGVAEYEPAAALFTEPGQPYAPYERVLQDAERVLRPDGQLVLELGRARLEGVARRADERGWQELDRRRDLGGVWRCLVLARRDA